MHENNTAFQNNLDPWMCARILNEAEESHWIIKKLQILCFRIPFFEDSVKRTSGSRERDFVIESCKNYFLITQSDYFL